MAVAAIAHADLVPPGDVEQAVGVLGCIDQSGGVIELAGQEAYACPLQIGRLARVAYEGIDVMAICAQRRGHHTSDEAGCSRYDVPDGNPSRNVTPLTSSRKRPLALE